MRKAVAEKIAGQVANWRHAGLIDADLAEILGARYASDVSMGRVFVRWLGFMALVMLGSSVLGFIGMMVGETVQYLAPFGLGAAAYVLWMKGTELAVDPKQTYATSGAVLITLALMVGYGALFTGAFLLDLNGSETAIAVVMLIASGAAIGTAYLYGLRWPLLLGVLLLFHGLGNLHRYAGGGSYYLWIGDERFTLFAAAVAMAVGLWHEARLKRDLTRQEVGFGQIYINCGLLYANLILWTESLTFSGRDLTPTLLFTAACIAQIVIGARLHDGRFTGFGIVFLSINIYTRLFEGFWDELSKGAFFMASGALALAVGAILEIRARNLRQRNEA
jgi:hypothetical protein